MFVWKNTIKKIGHRAYFGDLIGQTYPIYACTGTNHACNFIGSRYILLRLEARVFTIRLEKLDRYYKYYAAKLRAKDRKAQNLCFPDKINDKRKIDKFSNDILFTQRETWSNWWMIRDNEWVSFSTGTSRLKRHTRELTVENRKQELAISSRTFMVQCLSGSFTLAWKKKEYKNKKKKKKRYGPAQKVWHMIQLKLYQSVVFTDTTTSHPSLHTNSSSFISPSATTVWL